jgi:hypothetical protein
MIVFSANSASLREIIGSRRDAEFAEKTQKQFYVWIISPPSQPRHLAN